MRNLKIYIVSHKKFNFPNNKEYKPIQVGQGISFVDTRDNTGESIWHKNKNYCELTALYWIWKNDLEDDEIGLCHYRRYFYLKKTKRIFERLILNLRYKPIDDYISTELVREYLRDNDIILPRPVDMKKSLYQQYKESHNIVDLICAKKILLELYPEYKDSVNEVLNQNWMYSFNMFIMKRQLFNEYMDWLFKILFEVEKNILVSKDFYQARVFGFLSERLFTIYIYHNKFKIKEVPYIFIDEENKNFKYSGFKKCVIRVFKKKLNKKVI